MNTKRIVNLALALVLLAFVSFAPAAFGQTLPVSKQPVWLGWGSAGMMIRVQNSRGEREGIQLSVGESYFLHYAYGDATFTVPNQGGKGQVAQGSPVSFDWPGGYVVTARAADGWVGWGYFEVYRSLEQTVTITATATNPVAVARFSPPEGCRVGGISFKPSVKTLTVDPLQVRLRGPVPYHQEVFLFDEQEISWRTRDEFSSASGKDGLITLVISHPEPGDLAVVRVDAKIGYWSGDWQVYPDIHREELEPAKDTYVDAWYPDKAFGQRTDMQVRSSGEQKALLAFDYTSVPKGSVIISAKLVLPITARGAHRMSAYLWGITEEWGEGTTWRTQPSVDSRLEGESSFGNDVHFDLNNLSQRIVDGKSAYTGFLLQGFGWSNVKYDIGSREHWDVSKRPLLQVTYVD